MLQLKKLSALLAITVTALFASVACTVDEPTDGDDSHVGEAAEAQSNHCLNKCAQTFNKCVKAATNPGGLNMCDKQNENCLAACSSSP